MKIIGSILLLASAILFVTGQLLFSKAPAGGREQSYTQSAGDLRHAARDSERISLSYYNKSVGIDKSDEPKDNSEWLQWHHLAKAKTESYSNIASINRSKAQELDELARNMSLARREHLSATRLVAAVLCATGLPTVLISFIRRKGNKTANLLPSTTP